MTVMTLIITSKYNFANIIFYFFILKNHKLNYDFLIIYLFKLLLTATAIETVAPTIGLLPIPINPIIST